MLVGCPELFLTPPAMALLKYVGMSAVLNFNYADLGSAAQSSAILLNLRCVLDETLSSSAT
jgi:hypothetical protein